MMALRHLTMPQRVPPRAFPLLIAGERVAEGGASSWRMLRKRPGSRSHAMYPNDGDRPAEEPEAEPV